MPILSHYSQIKVLIPRNAFAKGVAVLAGGTAVGQAIGIVAAPLLTRLYSPEDFGLLAVYTSLLALVGVASSLRYELAIPLPEDDAEAANVAALSLLLVGVSSLLTVAVIGLIGPEIIALIGVPELSGYLWLLPLGVLLFGVYKVFNFWAVRTKLFTTIASTKLSQAIATIVIQLGGFSFGGIALLVGLTVGKGVGTIDLARRALVNTGFQQVTWQGIGKVANRFRRFPFFSTWGGLANTAGLQLPPILLAALFNPVAAGYFAMANRVLSLPMSLIGGAVGQVFFSNAAEAHRKGELAPLVANLHAKLAHIGMAPALIVGLIGPDLFSFIFGEEWRTAGEFARWLAPWLYLVFVTSPLSTVTTVTERQKQGLYYHLTQLALRLIVITVGGWLGDLSLTIILYGSASGFCRLGYLVWLIRISGNSIRVLLSPTLSAMGFALLSILPILAVMGTVRDVAWVWAVALLMTGTLIASRYFVLMKDAYTKTEDISRQGNEK